MKTQSTYHNQWQKTKSFSSKICSKEKLCAFTSSIQNSIESLEREMRIKEKKVIQVRKEALKPFLFEDMILYV
jgi:hypothetical protein